MDTSTQAQLERWARYPKEQTMSITKLQAVKYDDRTDIIEPLGWPDAESMEEEVEAVNSTYVEFIEPVNGWGEYNYLILSTNDLDDETYYLVVVDDDPR